MSVTSMSMFSLHINAIFHMNHAPLQLLSYYTCHLPYEPRSSITAALLYMLFPQQNKNPYDSFKSHRDLICYPRSIVCSCYQANAQLHVRSACLYLIACKLVDMISSRRMLSSLRSILISICMLINTLSNITFSPFKFLYPIISHKLNFVNIKIAPMQKNFSHQCIHYINCITFLMSYVCL